MISSCTISCTEISREMLHFERWQISSQASVGEQGYVARHSAKEFAVLMPNYDIFSARNLAESIQKQILHMRNDSADYKLKILTVSVGISAAPYAARSAKELLDNADLAVYHVKRSGKNGIEDF